MPLYRLHKILIISAIVFCAIFAVRQLAVGSGGVVDLTLGAASVAIGLGLSYYLRWLIREKGSALDRTAAGSREPPS